ncbi:MAG: hypothetical protein ACE5DM_05520 [Candidatus Nanoarchaeia archaeon]
MGAMRELIIGFGFLEGIWLAIGVNPSDESLKYVIMLAENIGANPWWIFFLNILPIATLLASLYLVYRTGGFIGFLACGIAFLGGFMVLQIPILSSVLLMLAFVVGHFAKK